MIEIRHFGKARKIIELLALFKKLWLKISFTFTKIKIDRHVSVISKVIFNQFDIVYLSN